MQSACFQPVRAGSQRPGAAVFRDSPLGEARSMLSPGTVRRAALMTDTPLCDPETVFMEI